MAGQLRVVRRRIRSVQSTMKITRAFELISASRVARAQQRVQQARPYTTEVTRALTSVANTEVTVSHPLLEQRAELKAAAVLVVSSDRGLAGPYNSNVLRTTEELVARLRQDGVEPKIYAVFTDYVSAVTQRAKATRFIPLVVEETEERPPEPIPMYIYEPDAQAVLDALLPRYIEARVFTAMLEAAASEHAARRKAMSAATDNAEELIEDLTQEYNQARQAAITQEIMEIVGGAEALGGSGS